MRPKSLGGALLLAAVLLAGALGVQAQVDNQPVDETKRFYLKSANPDGSLVCAPGCHTPLGFCC